MVNLIAGKEVVPELVQSNFTVENIVSGLAPLLSDTVTRSRMLEDLGQVRAQLKSGMAAGGGSSAERAAEAVLNAISYN
jgi:lipid-A-disaccharide synthase